MDNLFSEDPQFRRVQYKKLSDNVREWQQEVSAIVTEHLPKGLDLETTVVFQNVDDEKGYAVGTAIARDVSGGKQIGIPIIVKSWHLAPIDLFFMEGKIYPLNDDNVAKAFYQNSLGVGVAPRRPPPQMSDDVFADARNPPMGGKYSYSAPLSDILAGTRGAADIQLLKQAVMSNPAVLGGYHRRGTIDTLQKYAADDKPKEDQQDAINKERASAVFTIKKDGPDSYRLYSANDEVYDPVMVSTDRQGLKHFLDLRCAKLEEFEKDPLTSVDHVGHFTLEPPKSVYGLDVDGPDGKGVDGSGGYAANLGPRKNPWVFDPLQDDRVVTTIDKFGRYGVRDRDGVLAKGWVIPNVVSFDGNPVPVKLFLGKALASIQGRISGIRLDDDANVSLQADRADTGKIGTLVYRDGERVMATCPFQVTAVTVFKNLRSLSVVDYKGNHANLILSPNVNGIVRVADSQRPELGPLMGPKANYIVSAKMFFVRMPRLCPVSESPDDFKRIALEHLDVNPIKVAAANGRYIFRGGAISKYAAAGPFDFNNLQRHEAEFLLCSWGLGHDKTAEVLNGVRSRMQLEVHHLRFPPVASEVKVASWTPAIKKLVRDIKPPMADLVKIASNLKDSQSVDSVLGLGFVNEENLERFSSAQAMLWEVAHMLSKLLLASRLGMEDIPEEAVRSALQHLQRVITGLGRLKLLGDHQEKTSAPRPRPGAVGGRVLEAAAPLGFAR
jgi:hypothetical protein